MDAVEAVARALYVAKGAHNVFGPWEAQLYQSLKEPFRRQAKALAEPIVAEALSAARPFIAAEWQPIETAPKDGTLVLFHVPGNRPLMGRADDYWSGMAVYLDGVTHWHPTPAPPTAIKETIR